MEDRGPGSGSGRRYDDGTTGVPDGARGPVSRVILIGAGMAGLTAASALAHAGIDAVALEGRDRIGGRLHTVGLGGSMVDLGGSWIHTPLAGPAAPGHRRSIEPEPEMLVSSRAGSPI